MTLIACRNPPRFGSHRRSRMAGLAAVLLATPLCLGSGAAAKSPAPDCALTERNRAIITKFADLFYAKHDVRAAFGQYVVPNYIQHNPGLPDGRDAAITMLEPMMHTTGAVFSVKRIIVDGNYAVIHLLGHAEKTNAGAAVTDIYRMADGKIVEHWDVIQMIPSNARNPHPMF